MSTITTNYSYKAINAAIKHYDAFLDNTLVSQKRFHLDLTINIDFDILTLQARTFASEFKSHYHMNFENRMSIPLDKIENILFQTYIYSFVKCIYNAFFRSDISQHIELGFAFEGHCKLYHILRNQFLTDMKDEVVYSYEIDYGTLETRRALFIKLFGKYQFLKEFINSSIDSFGTKAFRISDFEGYLLRMKTRAEELKLPRRDKIANISNVSNSNVSDSNMNNSKSKSNSNNNNRQLEINRKYPQGIVQINEMNNTNCSNIVDFSNNPCFNSFFTEDGKTEYYIPILEGKPIIYNASYFYNKANFIVLSNKQDMKIFSRAYQKESITDRQLHFVCSEVFTNTGIKPASLKNFKNKVEDKYPISKIVELLKKDTGNNVDKIFVDILEKVSSGGDFDSSDLSSIISKLLEPFVK